MTRKIINVGVADKGNGDPLRVAFSKANDNFAELYNILSNNTGGSIITTDVIGSVFADDSTLLVDGINGSIPYSVLSGAPTIPAAQVQSNWTAASGMGVILNKPTFATVATTGAYADLTGKPTLFSGSYNDLTDKPNNIAGTYQFSVAADDSTQRVISTDEVVKFVGAGGITTASDAEGNITITGSGGSSLVNGANTVSLGSDGVVTFPGGVFTISNYQASTQIETWTVGVTNMSPTNSIPFYGHSSKLFDTTWTISGSGITGQSAITAINPIMSGMSITGYTVTIAQTISTGLVTGDYVFSNPPITQGVNFSSDLSTWTFGNNGSLTFPNGTVQTTAPESFSFSVAADDSTQRTISNNESIKFIGAGGITTASDAEGNITINYVQGDIRSEGNIDIEINLSDSTLRRWRFGEDGDLTFPNGVLKIAGNTISNYVAGDMGGSGSQLEVAPTKTVITNGVTTSLSEGGPSLISQALFEVSTNGILSSFQVINTLGEGESSLTSEYLTELDYNSFKIGQRTTNDLGDGSEPLVAFNGWTFGTVDQQQVLTFPDGTTQTTAPQSFSFSVAADDSTQRAISNNELIKFIGAGGITTASDAEGNITINYVQGDIRSEGNINIDINLTDSTLRRWRFGEDGILTLPSTGKINNGNYEWTFGSTGALTLPAGGVISEGGGISGAIKLKPAGGANANQALLIYPTANPDGDHVHLTAGGGSTELYLGNDTHYVKLVDGGNVEVRASTANLSAQAAWTFETDGELDTIRPLGIKVPNGVPTDVAVINSTTGSWEMNPRSNLATTGGSGTGLTVNVTEEGGYASTIAVATAGTGYFNGDVITVTSGTSNATFTIVIGGRNTWTFGTDGDLTLPYGAVLNSTAGNAIAFGNGAGTISQGSEAVAIGVGAGGNSQGGEAVAIGSGAGNDLQGINAVAIGGSAGRYNQGANAVAIGKMAGLEDQAANSIIINATGATLNQTTANTFTVAPIRNISATSGVLQYNASTKEVSYSNNVTAGTFNTDQITVVGNRISTTVTNANLELECNGSGGVVINTLADATTASTVKSVGYLGLPQSATATSATLAIGDAGKHIYVTTNSQTITIPANASVAYPIGTTLTFIAGPSPVVTVTIAITSDTLRLAGGTSTGTRTLAANGMATAVKVAATTWYINGTGLT